jgi:hypothetical protein
MADEAKAKEPKKESPKPKTKKQAELPGMPARTELEKAAAVVLDKWEDLQGKKAELFDAKVKLLGLMKKANRTKLCLTDSNDIKRKIEYKESEGITVAKASPEE